MPADFAFAVDAKFWRFLKASSLPWMAVGLLVVLGIVVITWVRKRYRDREDREAAMQQMLLQFREIKREGDLTDEEYRSIKNRLVEQIGKPSRDKSGENPQSAEKTAQPVADKQDDGGDAH